MLEDAAPRVAILLSTFNGDRFLGAQLDSFVAQTHTNWVLYWRDDGSSDGTRALLRKFADGPGAGRCIEVGAAARQRATNSFLTLLREAVTGPASFFAFSDQDDVWLPDKLAHGVAALTGQPDGRPAMFFCPRALVDIALQPAGTVPMPRYPLGLLTALTQNVIPGCCMMLNRPAAELAAAAAPPEETWHDWWCYLLVAAHEGAIAAGTVPDILYRQHPDNLVGEANGIWRRGVRAIGRGPGPFMRLFWGHVAALEAAAADLPPESRARLSRIARSRERGVMERLRTLSLPGFVRQTWMETLVFRLWFLLG